jgi:hypothetical protein
VEPSITNLITNEIVPVVRAALRELTELRGAVQLLGERVETPTAELAEGGLPELIRLATGVLRTLDIDNGRRRP